MDWQNSAEIEPSSTTNSIKISVAIASFNRRETTLNCIRSLVAQQSDAIALDIYLLDDGSTDGTTSSVQMAFPNVQITQGDGNLFWGGGMNVAMSQAIQSDPDFILMLNDDVALFSTAIASSLADYETAAGSQSDPKQIIVGATSAPGKSDITYSGFRRTKRLDPSKVERIFPDSNSLRACDTMNGNFVLVPRSVFTKLGPIDPAFVHQLGDLDYGYRAKKIGGKIWIAKQPIGECAANERVMPFKQAGLSLAHRWKFLNTPLGLPLRPWATFMWRHGGVPGIFRLLLIYAARLANR